jgi:hypothetical protein
VALQHDADVAAKFAGNRAVLCGYSGSIFSTIIVAELVEVERADATPPRTASVHAIPSTTTKAVAIAIGRILDVQASGRRISARIPTQPSADDTQMEPAMRLARCRDRLRQVFKFCFFQFYQF